MQKLSSVLPDENLAQSPLEKVWQTNVFWRKKGAPMQGMW